MRGAAKSVVVVAGVVAVALIGVLVFRGAASRRTIVSYVTRPVAYADIVSSVTETGTVNPVNQVAIGSEVSGTVATVNADYNSLVHAGEVLATLDPTSFQAAVDSAQASLRLAQASLDNARNNVQKTQAQWELAQLKLSRDEELAKQGLLPQSQIDTDRTAELSARLDQRSAQGAVAVGETQVSVAEAGLRQARYNLQRTIITSPIDGVVLSRSVSVGQSVAASLQAPTLFVLATSLAEMQVDAAVDEADVGSVQSGQPAAITVTAYPNSSFSGTVKEVRVDPTTVQNVVTYDAVVSVHDSTGRLLPGMTAQVTIQTGSREHVLAVPIAALLYRPAAERSNGSNGGRSPAGPVGGLGGGFFGGGHFQSTATTASVAGAPGSKVLVWVVRDGNPAPVQVTIGMSDERNVELTSGELRAGDAVIISERAGGSTQADRSAAGAGRSSSGGRTPANGSRAGAAR